jgi:DNA-directed RNA polymerase subunit M/transcription elongation factor TFIIS
MLMELCPCCGVRLLRHASQSGSYLRCGSCRFEIPEDLQSVTDENSKSASGLLDTDNLITPETATAS